jgi:hypothetical protein
MRNRAAILIVALSVPLVAGCSAEEPPVAETPTASATPVFASEEEALAAAEEAYAAYQAAIDQVLADGGDDPGRMNQYATGDALSGALDSATQFRTEGLSAVGSVAFTLTSVQDYSPTGLDDAVVAYACLDVSGVDVVNSDGVSVISANRPDHQPFVLRFSRKSEAEKTLMVSKRDAWDGSEVCGE